MPPATKPLATGIPIWFVVVIALYNCAHIFGVYYYHAYERAEDTWDFRVFHSTSLTSPPDVKPYINNGYLHQPFNKEKTPPWLIYLHVLCGTIPSVGGCVLLWSGPDKLSRATHRLAGTAWMVFTLMSAAQGCYMSWNMLFSHTNFVLQLIVFLFGLIVATCAVLGWYYIKKDTRDVIAHRAWVMRGWGMMQFFITWARLAMGIVFVVSGSQYSFVIGAWIAIITTPFLLEGFVLWSLQSTDHGDAYRFFGPIPGVHSERKMIKTQ